MQIKLFLLLLLFFAITPNLGFFTIPAFLIITFIFLILLVLLFYQKANKLLGAKIDRNSLAMVLFSLLLYSGVYYGGLYQEKSSIIVGQFIFFALIIYSFFNFFIFKKAEKNYFSWIIILTYLCLAILTILGSPHPTVDTIVVLKEAPLKFINGDNPYSSVFSQVYKNITPNYYNYLPFSFIYTLPFVLFFSDPRYSVIFANLTSSLIIFKIFNKKKDKSMLNLIVLTLLLLPRSFYMLEHTYLDTIIFNFFLIYMYFNFKEKKILSFLFLALFFSFKQNVAILFPLFLKTKIIRSFFSFKNLIFFLIPFLLPLYFLIIDPGAFLNDTLQNLTPSSITSPIKVSLTFPTFFNNFILSEFSKYVNLVFISLFLFFYFLILRQKLTLTFGIAMVILFFNFLMYHAFFNNYYLAAQFLLLEIASVYFEVRRTSNLFI